MRDILSLTFAAVCALALGGCSQDAAPDAPADAETSAAAPADLGPPPPPEAADADAAEPAVIEGVTNKRLAFAPGTASARVEGTIKGDETVDYLLNVKAGQSLNISMATPNTAAYFNLLEPGETEVAVFNGSMAENMFEGVAAKSGDYRIRVYLIRSAARRGETASYTLEASAN